MSQRSTIKINNFFLSSSHLNIAHEFVTTPEDFERTTDSITMQSAPRPDFWNSVVLRKCKLPIAEALNILWWVPVIPLSLRHSQPHSIKEEEEKKKLTSNSTKSYR